MRRSGPLRRRSELRRGAGPKRKQRLAPISRRRRAEAPDRDAVRDATIARQGGVCALAWHSRCRGRDGRLWRRGDRLEVHEVVRRGARPGAHLDERLTLALCARHHDLDTRLPVAESLGIRAPGWAVERYGVDAVAEDLAAIRAALAAGLTPPPTPRWR